MCGSAGTTELPKLETGFAKLESGFAKLESGFAKLEYRFIDDEEVFALDCSGLWTSWKFFIV